MPAVSSPTLASWRGGGVSTDIYIYPVPATVVFRARVPAGTFTFPMTQLPYDTVTVGSSSDLREGMTLLLGTTPGGDDLGRNRIRAAADGTVATSSLINVGRCSRGTRDGELNPTALCYITVLDMRMVWAHAPWIDSDTDPDDPVTYKDGVIAFNATSHIRPVANPGAHVLHIVAEASDTVNVAFGQTASFTRHPDANGTLTYLYTFSDGSTSTSATPTKSFGVGKHWNSLTVTDNLGNTHTAWRLVVVQNRASTSLLKGASITSHRQGRDGQELRIQLTSELPYSTYPDGTMFLIARQDMYAGTEQNLNTPAAYAQMVFAGWEHTADHEGDARDGNFLGRSTLTLLDIAGKGKTLPAFPLIVERESSPTRWEQMKGANVDRYVHHLLDRHSNILTLADFTDSGTGETFGFTVLGSDGGNLYEQADIRTQAIAHKLVCDQFGRLYMRPDPVIMPTSTQASSYSLTARTSTVILNLTSADWKRYRYSYQRPPRVHWNWGEAIIASTVNASANQEIGTVFCVAPGSAPGQGVNAQNSGQQLVRSQNELNVREGHRYASRMNARYNSMTIEGKRVGDIGLDPALMELVTITIDSSTKTPRGFPFTAKQFLLTEVDWRYESSKGLRYPTWTFEEVVEGTEAVTYVPKSDPGTVIVDEPPITVDTNPDPGQLGRGTGTIAMFCSNGKMYITRNFTATSPTWTATDLTALTNWPGGTLACFTVDAFSPRYVGTGATVNGWLATTAGVCRINDIFGAVNLSNSSAHNHTAIGVNGVAMNFERGLHNWGICAYNAGSNGTRARYTTDGNNWTEVSVTAHYDTFGNVNMPGLVLDAHRAGHAFIAAPTSTGQGNALTVGLYETFNYGATWALTSTPATSLGVGSYGVVHTPYQNDPITTLFYEANDHTYFRRNTTDITPTISGTSYVPWRYFLRSMATCDVNQNVMAFVGQTTGGSAAAYMITTNNVFAETPVWQRYATPFSAPEQLYIAGGDPLVRYIIGANANIAYTQDGGVTIVSKNGNLTSESAAYSCGICGG
jgi:hypothetical protein